MDNSREPMINIDTEDFVNPFFKCGYSGLGRKLYTNYLSSTFNHTLLKQIGDNRVFTSDSTTTNWTRSECLQSLSCLYNYRKKLTHVKRDILNIQYGIIVHLVTSQEEPNDDLSATIFERWPIVLETYKKVKVRNPGIIQMVRVNSEASKFPLFVCNFFGQDENTGFFADRIFIQRALKNIRKFRIGDEVNLPIYFPFQMGCSKENGERDWQKYTKFIKKYCSDAIICM